MATVAESLFGISPESLQRSRQQQLRQEAMDYASIADPFQQANFAIYQGVGNLTRGVGGLLGAQDPELMRVRQRQQLLQNVDISDPVSLREAASRLMQSGDSPAAAELAKRAMDIEKAQAQITKDTAAAAASEAAAKRDRTPQTPADIAKAQRIAALRSAIPAYEAAGDTTTAQQLKDELDALLPADKIPSFGAEADRIAVATYGKPFGQLTREQAAEVDKIIEKRDLASRKAGKTDLVLPGQQVKPKDWGDFVDRLDKNPLFKQSASIISAAPSALETIRMSTSNDIAAVAIGPQLARMAGESGALSAQDVNRWAKAGGLDDRLIGSAVSFFTGRLTQTKKAEAEKYVSAVFRGALLEQKRLLEDNAEEFGYDESPNYKKRIKNIESQLDRFKKPSEVKPPVDSVVRKPPQPQPTGNPLIDKYLINP